jgi:hypothetical protein
MNTAIELFTSLTGWTSNGTISASSINQIPDYIAGLNAGSVVFFVPAGNNGKYVQKTIAFDPTKYNEVVFHVWSRNNGKKGWNYNKSTDFAYKIDFGTGKEYFIPTLETFEDVTFSIKTTTPMTKIKITALTDGEDYLIMSNMLAVRDEIPRDIFQGVKEQIQVELNRLYPTIDGGVLNKGLLLGTFSGTTGEKSIYLKTGFDYIEKYATILIDDGANSEIHQIAKSDNQEFTFSDIYAGKTLLHNHTTASIYLIVPVEYGLTEKDIILPGISIWGMEPEEILRSNKLDEERDTFTSDETVDSRQSMVTFSYKITLDCEARQNEALALMSYACRSLIAKQFCWVNGKKLNIFLETPPEYVPAIEAYNEIPKIQFICRVEIREDVWDRQILVKTVTNTLNVEPTGGN